MNQQAKMPDWYQEALLARLVLKVESVARLCESFLKIECAYDIIFLEILYVFDA